MTKSKLLSLLVTAVLLLNGCAAMSGDECLASDWQAIGFEDGAQGLGAERLGDYRRSCAKHGVTPDFTAYQDGHDQGLWQYCHPSRGFDVGANGNNYYGICANHQEAKFLQAFYSGQQLYRLRSELNNVESQIYNMERQLDRNDVLIRENQAMLIARDTSTEQRILLVVELKDLAEANGELEVGIEYLLQDILVHQQRLDEYESLLAEVH